LLFEEWMGFSRSIKLNDTAVFFPKIDAAPTLKAASLSHL